MKPPQNVSEAVRRLNPHLYSGPQKAGLAPVAHSDGVGATHRPPKRIMQSTKPLLNKLEQRFVSHLNQVGYPKPIHAQKITFRLANGLKYTPDVFCFEWSWMGENRLVAWEVKGPWLTDDGVAKLKMFAAAYPEILVLLAWEDKATNQWLQQIVYP